MKDRGASKIKVGIILGYFIVVVVMTVGLIALYRNLVDFSNKRIRTEDMSELMIVGKILSLLYEVESEQNLFTAGNAKKYHARYDSVIPAVKDDLNRLKEFTEDNKRKLELDSIGLLMENKSANLSDIVLLLDSLSRAPDIITKSESSYVPRELNREISDYLEKRNFNSPNTAQSDTSVIAGERKGFLDRVRNVFVANTDSTIVIENRSVVSDNEFRLIVDTIVNKVRYSERLDLSKQRQIHFALIQRQEAMTLSNRMLTARIDELLKNIEQEEIRKSLLLISEKERTLSRSQNTMLTVSLLSIIIAIFFAVLLLIDINKSQSYRRKLESSNKRIMDLLDYREKLMLMISHDIKAPTGSILGFIDLMTDENINAKSESYLNNMKISAEHVLQLVSQLLDYHKLDKGSWQLREAAFNLHTLIEESTTSFRPIAEKKGLKYSVDNLLPEELSCIGDSYVLKQVINNLIYNAVKYTQQGEINIVANTRASDETNIFVFNVADTGEGIDDENQKDIFNGFRQVSSHINIDGRVEGSGLGLAITKGFIKEMKGEIYLTSAKGKGSEFRVEIPLKPVPEDFTDDSADIPNDFDLEGVSMLYVDDDPVQLKMMSEIALKKKMKCITESDPENMPMLLKSNIFDILFIDIHLGEDSGFDLVDKINSDVPVIAISARSDITKAKVKIYGFTDFLNKPFSLDQLYKMIYYYVKSSDNTSRLTVTGDKSKGVSALYEFVKEDTAASLEILQSFINETKRSRLILKEALKNNDINTASRISHKLLPLFRMIGDEKVVKIMELLDNRAYVNGEDKDYLLDAINDSIIEATEHSRVLNKN